MSVYKRKKTGTWEFRKTIRGVKYYRSLPEAQNRPQAEVAAAQILREIYEGRYGKEGHEIGSTDFIKFCREVYLPDIKERLRQAKNHTYKVETLCRYFKGKKLKDITLIAIQGYRRKRLAEDSHFKRPRQASTVKDEISVLSGILNMAIDAELLGLNPCRKLKWGKGQTGSSRERVLSDDEEKKLMPQLERFPETRMAVVLSLNTGLRRMGILQSKVSGVDERERTLSYIAKGGKVRVVPLNSVAWAVMEELLKQPTSDGFLFHKRTGHNLSAGDGAFQLAVRRAGIKDLHFHDLRHTFCTRVKIHADAFTVRDLMGHEDVETTGIYANTPSADMVRAVESLVGGKVLKFERVS